MTAESSVSEYGRSLAVHLRRIQFALVAVSFALLTTLKFGQETGLDAALSELDDILEVRAHEQLETIDHIFMYDVARVLSKEEIDQFYRSYTISLNGNTEDLRFVPPIPYAVMSPEFESLLTEFSESSGYPEKRIKSLRIETIQDFKRIWTLLGAQGSFQVVKRLYDNALLWKKHNKNTSELELIGSYPVSVNPPQPNLKWFGFPSLLKRHVWKNCVHLRIGDLKEWDLASVALGFEAEDPLEQSLLLDADMEEHSLSYSLRIDSWNEEEWLTESKEGICLIDGVEYKRGYTYYLTVPAATTEVDNTAQQTLISLFRGKFATRWVPGSFDSTFPFLARHSSDLLEMPIGRAKSILAEEFEQSSDSVNIFGTPISTNHIATVGPVVIICLQLYFLLHLRHFASMLPSLRQRLVAPWLVLYPDRLARLIAALGVVALPCLTVVLLANIHALSIWSSFGYSLITLALGAYSTYVLTLVWKQVEGDRRHLGVSAPSANSIPD